ncbi:DUF2190 family protein [Rhodosalinus sp.]|uniref:DUF2190 family protein n=1 Tax=Rhodosalinus sp. TaxID=2047741 RepID=UPI0035693DC7
MHRPRQAAPGRPRVKQRRRELDDRHRGGGHAGEAEGQVRRAAELPLAPPPHVGLPNPSAEAWTQSVALYQDESAGRVTTGDASGANAQIGHAFAPAANPSDERLVLLGR